MIGHASVLFVFVLSIYWNIWNIIPEDSQFILGFAFLIAFLNADEPIVKIVKQVKERIMDD